MRNRWRAAVLDSGLAGDAGPALVAACRFIDNGQEILTAPAIRDPIGHGTAVTDILCRASAPFDLLVGQVLDHRGIATPAAVAAAIHWSVEEGANLIHMSLGLREDRRVLADAVAAALQAGCVVIASTPARGEGTFPANYPQVIRATGDARCESDEISALDTAQADFGGSPGGGGASLGAAHVTGFVIARIAPGSSVEQVRSHLLSLARWQGPERKTA